MSYVDLTRTLKEWSYDSERVSVRKILADDASVKIQMRVELGILQMEETGRPDGQRPYGFESLLAYHRSRLDRHLERNGTTLGYALDAGACDALRSEMSQYYRRYVAMFVLDEFEHVVRDTSHNLGVMDLCRDYAFAREDRRCLETFRPYVLMMNARAHAANAIRVEDATSALAHINRGMTHIRSHLTDLGQDRMAEPCEELKLLEQLSRELADVIPENSLLSTRKALMAAVKAERFEEAAKLRDTLEKLYQANGSR
ncbi:MAG: UvrB/UvrC motif-containing protein [Phycisphaerae bacterium]